MSNLVSVSDARTNLPSLVSRVGKNMDRVTITVNGKPMATLISEDELESIEETAEILSIPGARESIKKGLREAKMGKGIPLSKLK
jgi:antitoxin YefM